MAQPGQLSYERGGPRGATPLVLVHAGIADRRMWDPIWPALVVGRDVLRVDLRGYGNSTDRPTGEWSPRADVVAVLAAEGISRAHLIGCSFGSGVCAEIAIEAPGLVASLVLAAPGGSLIPHATAALDRFVEQEDRAMDAGDADAATEVNLRHWVDGSRPEGVMADVSVRDAVRQMQRQAFAITSAWPDAVWSAEQELDPESHERLGEIIAPTLVLTGGLDMDAITNAAEKLAAHVPGAVRLDWPDVAHLPSMERPDDFVVLVSDWLDQLNGQ